MTLSVAGVNMPENGFHYVTDPAGYKGKRDQKLIERIEKWQKRDRYISFFSSPSSSSSSSLPAFLFHCCQPPPSP